jgi:hypothetical protein
MKMPHLWKSAKGTDFHKLLGTVSPKSGETFPHFPPGCFRHQLLLECNCCWNALKALGGRILRDYGMAD